MATGRISIVKKWAKGWSAAVVLTLLGMLLIAAAVLLFSISDAVLTAMNQLLKAFAIVVGTRCAVGRGGHRGLLTGIVMAMLYMISGYILYVLLGGGSFSAAEMLGEILIGTAIGGVCGAIFANLPPKKGTGRNFHSSK